MFIFCEELKILLGIKNISSTLSLKYLKSFTSFIITCFVVAGSLRDLLRRPLSPSSKFCFFPFLTAILTSPFFFFFNRRISNGILRQVIKNNLPGVLFEGTATLLKKKINSHLSHSLKTPLKEVVLYSQVLPLNTNVLSY